MRYIDNNMIEDEALRLNWNQTKKDHYDKLQKLSASDRKEYITAHPDWNEFQSVMLKLSYNKCWYSEAPIGNNDFEIDHFRPKNKARQKIDYTKTKSKSCTHKENGYWWLAYSWENYRLSGALANKRRRDRLGDCDDVKGKGDYFPLDLGNGRIAEDEENTSCEVAILLDPINPLDVCLLTFDNGKPMPASTDQYEIDRVKQSIFYYHLDLDQLNTARKIVWDNCVDHIKDAKNAIDNSVTKHEKYEMMKKCFKELRKLVNPEKADYTSTAKACLMVYSEISGHNWLKELIRTI